jgi:hypothetical protein
MYNMEKVSELRKHLHAGRVYRRADLVQWSKAVDRHLQQLVEDGTVKKLAGGLYYCPKKTSFGDAPPDDDVLVQSFLKDDHFYIASLNAYNSLGVGTTQLYNEKLVYNYKRDGRKVLNGRNFYFVKRPRFPKKSNEEFLLVDLVNNLHMLAEDTEEVLKHVAEKMQSMNKEKLMKAVHEYAGARAKNFFAEVFRNSGAYHAL